jgi:hypothetical protein
MLSYLARKDKKPIHGMDKETDMTEHGKREQMGENFFKFIFRNHYFAPVQLPAILVPSDNNPH